MNAPTFSPAGDSAILVSFGSQIDLQVNRRVHALAGLLRAAGLAGLGEAVPGYTTLLVNYDPLVLEYEQALAAVQAQASRAVELALPPARRVEVPVYYGGEFGPDLDFVARHSGLRAAEVVRIHAAGEYPVYFIGFTPGFPYLGGLDERIAAPRLETPRPLVRAGSVGIAGQQTGIYSVDSPGGWRLIGWTPLALFDPAADPPARLAPGDVVKFVIESNRLPGQAR
jgi:KipI family sensor histidine kinase inhibitor